MVRIDSGSNGLAFPVEDLSRRDILGLPRVLLAIAHPGHELFVHGWLEQTRPLVAVLTDGSGRNRSSRLDATTRVLRNARATPTSIYGAYPDRRVYEAVRARDENFFLTIGRSLEELVIETNVNLVVGDAAERAILVHDLWRAVVDAALARAGRRRGRPIANYEFPIERAPRVTEEGLSSTAAIGGQAVESRIACELSVAAAARKLTVARGYEPLRAEVEALLERRGVDWLSHERLSPAAPAWDEALDAEAPPYEVHGRQLAQASIYPEAIEFQRHVRPLLDCVRDWSEAK